MRRSVILTLLLIALTSLFPTGAGAAVQAQQPRCFQETGFCVQGRFLDYWEAKGGLSINGFPISVEFTQRLDDGNTYLVQYFERARFEYHPENDDLTQVLLGQFGRKIYGTDAPVNPIPGRDFFPETGHTVGPLFMDYWRRNGGLAQFGYPLSELIDEVLENGKSYQVQYFERARFEYHPENPKPYDVLLGQFGRVILAESRANYPLVLAPCTDGLIFVEQTGLIHSTDPGPDRPYACKFKLPKVDPSNAGWLRLYSTVNTNLYEETAAGWILVNPDRNGVVRLHGGRTYMVQGLTGSWWVLIVRTVR